MGYPCPIASGTSEVLGRAQATGKSVARTNETAARLLVIAETLRDLMDRFKYESTGERMAPASTMSLPTQRPIPTPEPTPA